MSAQLDEEYLTWLYSQVASVKARNLSRTYWSLAKALYKKEFIWRIPNDDNRVEDGRDLRYQFMDEVYGVGRRDVDPVWLGLGCSMFEMLIALSRRLAFEADDEPRVWFWHLIETMELKEFNDRCFDDYAEQKTNEVMDRIIWRTYSYDGQGGLFPLRHAEQDQTTVEIWYQMSNYLLELL